MDAFHTRSMIPSCSVTVWKFWESLARRPSVCNYFAVWNNRQFSALRRASDLSANRSRTMSDDGDERNSRIIPRRSGEREREREREREERATFPLENVENALRNASHNQPSTFTYCAKAPTNANALHCVLRVSVQRTTWGCKRFRPINSTKNESRALFLFHDTIGATTRLFAPFSYVKSRL